MGTARQQRRHRTIAGDDETATIVFAPLPHGIASDLRLKPVERLAVSALLYWACDRTASVVSNERLGSYLGVCDRVVIRSLRSLEDFGYIRCETVRPTRGNMTGRLIHLLWRMDSSMIPDPPSRASYRGQSEPFGPPQDATEGMTLKSYPRAGGYDSGTIPSEGGGSDSGVREGLTLESGGYVSHVILGLTLESGRV